MSAFDKKNFFIGLTISLLITASALAFVGTYLSRESEARAVIGRIHDAVGRRSISQLESIIAKQGEGVWAQWAAEEIELIKQENQRVEEEIARADNERRSLEAARQVLLDMPTSFGPTDEQLAARAEAKQRQQMADRTAAKLAEADKQESATVIAQERFQSPPAAATMTLAPASADAKNKKQATHLFLAICQIETSAVSPYSRHLWLSAIEEFKFPLETENRVRYAEFDERKKAFRSAFEKAAGSEYNPDSIVCSYLERVSTNRSDYERNWSYFDKYRHDRKNKEESLRNTVKLF